jgi:hypothetical protein
MKSSFQRLESEPAGFPRIGQVKDDFFQGLEKHSRNFPSLGKPVGREAK